MDSRPFSLLQLDEAPIPIVVSPFLLNPHIYIYNIYIDR
jgi:hypothetical protein